MKKTLASAGYTVEITSWENVGGNCATAGCTYKTREEALAVLNLCKNCFASCNSKEKGAGNLSHDEYEKAEDIIMDYIEKNPYVKWSSLNREYLIDAIADLNLCLLGSSELYYSRVYDFGCIYYCPEDVIVEKIC